MDGEHPLVASQLDAGVEAVRAGARRWATLRVRDKIAILKECTATTLRSAARWTELAAKAKGITGTPLAGEEALTGPWAVLAALNRYAETLDEIARFGAPLLDQSRLRTRPGNRVALDVFPTAPLDRLLQIGLRAEVWMQPGVSRDSLHETMGVWYREPRVPRVALILGAGNITSIGPLDVLTKLVADGCACVLKIHPLLDYLVPVYAGAFAPLISAGLLRLATGGAGVGRHLTTHPGIDVVHVTGSRATYEAIAAENASGKLITSELGNVSPAVVVPGDWSQRQLRHHAEQIATAKLHNGGFNCVALQVLVLPAAWNRKSELIGAIEKSFAEAQDRIGYYPGASSRYAKLVEDRTSRRFGRADEPFLARTILETDSRAPEDPLFLTEAFSPLLAIVELPGDDVKSYLREAVDFCNERLEGDLAANLIVDPRTAREHSREVDDAIASFRYGCIGLNVWSGAAFLLPPVPWGAYPGNTHEHIGSGTGVVHNSRLFSRSEKSVLHAPFAPASRRLRPPWFLSHRNQAEIGALLCDLEVKPSPATLAKLIWFSLTG